MRLRLKTAIWATGKSQRRIAADLGMAENRLSEIVCGWVDPTADERRQLAEETGEPAELLFALEESPN